MRFYRHVHRSQVRKRNIHQIPSDVRDRCYTARVVDQVQERKESSNAGRQTPTRDAARELNGIFDVLLEDEDYEDIVRNSNRKLETQAFSAMPCNYITASRPVHRMREKTLRV